MLKNPESPSENIDVSEETHAELAKLQEEIRADLDPGQNVENLETEPDRDLSQLRKKADAKWPDETLKIQKFKKQLRENVEDLSKLNLTEKTVDVPAEVKLLFEETDVDLLTSEKIPYYEDAEHLIVNGKQSVSGQILLLGDDQPQIMTVNLLNISQSLPADATQEEFEQEIQTTLSHNVMLYCLAERFGPSVVMSDATCTFLADAVAVKKNPNDIFRVLKLGSAGKKTDSFKLIKKYLKEKWDGQKFKALKKEQKDILKKSLETGDFSQNAWEGQLTPDDLKNLQDIFWQQAIKSLQKIRRLHEGM
jgi:hypothetical protein